MKKMHTLVDGWKKLLANTLVALGIMELGFNGQIIIDVRDGGVGSIKRSETLK